MDQVALYHASKNIISRNVTSQVRAVMVDWHQVTSHLELFYIFDEEPAEVDRELQEVALSELRNEFSEIASAECLVPSQDGFDEGERLVVFDRRG
jgi:hypothetical protein